MFRNDDVAGLVLILAVACSACGGDAGPKIGPPSAVTIAAGDAQTAEVGAALPVSVGVKVADAEGHGVPNVTVSWSAGNGGSATAVAPMTDKTGVAQARWTLGTTAGTQTLTATVVGLTAATLTATARPGAASQIAKNAGDAQSGTVATALTTKPAVKVSDRFGNGVSGASVTWTASGGGSVSAASSTTDATGIASTTWTLGTTAGAQKLTATTSGVSPVEFTATGQAGPAQNLTVLPANRSTDWGTTVQYSVTATDAYGNTVTKAPTWTSSDTSIASIASSGLATARRRGTALITATMDGRSAFTPLQVTTNNMKIEVQNTLRLGVTVYVNDIPIGTVTSSTTKEFSIATPGSLEFSWDVIKQRRTDGVEIGDYMGGYWDAFTPDTPKESFTIDHIVGTSNFFGPFVNNNSTANWLMGINMGLPYENRCFCTVLAGNQGIFLGYYRWVSTTNVRAYGYTSNYAGNYIYWENFQNNIGALDGAVTLFSGAIPNTVDTAGMLRPMAPSRYLPWIRPDHEKHGPPAPRPSTIAPVK